VKKHDVLDRLEEIKCPVMIMSGSEDLICSPTVQKWMADRIPHAEWIEYEGAAHFFLMEKAQRFMADLGGFLRKNTPA
jgi:pimeloyl-ACP methyl ester carboxylesterase